jgi:DegV family protein with EDD domain
VNRICVVTDSTAELAPDEIEEYRITVVPLDSVLDGKTYRDRVTLSEREFLELMEASGGVPMTSLPPVGSFLQAYDGLGREGSRVISIHLSGELSGTFNAARVAAGMSSADVTAVDSRFIARAHGFQVVLAAKLAQTGRFTVEEILAQLESARARTTQYLGVSQLKYLIKGGRISRVQGAVGNLLNIKVLLRMDDGNLVLDAKLLGMKAFERRLREIVERMGGEIGRIEEIGITHTGLTACTQGLIDRTKEVFAGIPLYVSWASASISAHSGVGAVSLQFLARDA